MTPIDYEGVAIGIKRIPCAFFAKEKNADTDPFW